MANIAAEINKKPKGAPRGKPFAKGQSGNKGGRPKLPEDVKHVRELARQYTEAAIDALAATLAEGGHSAKVAAANALLERGWGKAEQPIVGVPDGAEIGLHMRVTFE